MDEQDKQERSDPVEDPVEVTALEEELADLAPDPESADKLRGGWCASAYRAGV